MKRGRQALVPQGGERAGNPARSRGKSCDRRKKRKHEWPMSADGWDEPAEWGEAPMLEVDDEVRDFFSDE